MSRRYFRSQTKRPVRPRTEIHVTNHARRNRQHTSVDTRSSCLEVKMSPRIGMSPMKGMVDLVLRFRPE